MNHLNESQPGLMAARLANMRVGRPDKNNSANLPNYSQEQTAAMLNTSERTVRSAKKVIQNGTPDVVKAYL
jgi:hypothetical protein